ncbi:tryptophan synthase subunit beta [Kluyvera sp. CHPC 1.251]|uniref:tryptophan synthase subunit beta n=1 Tax=Kluyvera sp. CHPC 1.251 TaxID=2995175 RepID=UPI002FD86B91
MYYIQRDKEGRLTRVDVAPFDGMTEESSAEQGGISVLKASEDEQADNENARRLSLLEQSDLGMVRVLDDLIYLLIRKGVISITDLPKMAQVKLTNRSNARQELGGLEQLIGSDNGIF